ncbi:hypothetical protein [Tenacibaculum jejuense]|uniref:Peptidase S1 domain-containing protein n=1 Tax=Tenacibaculum jejuense TaxID=584609 RepID=A0A238U9R3_9FLAO|nr:hypothetical protein [Tenacibaculum jejuense]SNR15795.1 protein of unknown function [Tenacibaculum jejuense]
MSFEFLKNITVRISVDDGKTKTVGSGIITRNKENVYYVITAEHCIYGKKDARLSNIGISNIKIEYKKQNGDYLKELKISEVVYSKDGEEDISVLSVEIDDIDLDSIVYSSILNESDCSKLAFRGYPKWLSEKNQAKTFHCQIEENDNDSFYIKSDEIKDITFSKAIDQTSSGLSGSGVFDVKNGKIFLIGIITDLRDSTGIFGHLKCSKLDNVFNSLDYEVYPLSNSAQQLFFQSEKIDLENISLKIASLKEANNDRFDNLHRKCEVLYGISDVDEMVDEILTEFFKAEIELSKIGKLNGFIQNEFDEVQITLSKRVNRTFRNRQVQTINEAQKIYNDIRDLFFTLMASENKSEISTSKIELLGDIAVNELLLNCDLNFVKI